MKTNWVNVKKRLPNDEEIESFAFGKCLIYRADMNDSQQNMAYQIIDAKMLRFCSEDSWWMPIPKFPTPTPIKSTVYKGEWMVHAAHCCKECGCKYGEADCPVVTGEQQQTFDCFDCNNDKKKEIMDKLIEQALKAHKIVRYIPTFVDVCNSYKKLLDEEKPTENSISKLKEAMDSLTDSERLELIGNYCKYCGCKNPYCRCWDDN